MNEVNTKRCEVCENEKPLSDFYFRKETGKYRNNCKKCKPLNSKEAIAARLSSPFKICKHCGENKPTSEYQKAGKGKWLQPYCKICDSERKKKHRLDNIEKVKGNHKKYYVENKDTISERQKLYNSNNTEIIKARKKEYSEKNKESIREKGFKYRSENKEELAKRQKNRRIENYDRLKEKAAELRAKRTPEQKKKIYEQQRVWRIANKHKIKAQRQLPAVKERTRERNRIMNNQKSATDISFRILKNLRSRTRFALKKWNTIKSDTTESLLGCSIIDFQLYFTSLFKSGMSWELFMAGEIHIDHIKPCVHFDLRSPEQQRKCFHYTNLQPLWKIDNLKKGISII